MILYLAFIYMISKLLLHSNLQYLQSAGFLTFLLVVPAFRHAVFNFIIHGLEDYYMDEMHKPGLST